MKAIKYILYLVIIGLLFLPMIQQKYEVFEIKPLNGAFTEDTIKKTYFSYKKWFSGKYQEDLITYTNKKIGFKDFFIRVNNQIDFSIFRKAHAEGIVIGKNNHMFELDYILEYNGDYFIGKEFITKKIERVKFLQDFLKEKHNITLLVVFEPSKAEVYPEYIPDYFLSNGKKKSNYNCFVEECKRQKVKHLDLNQFFIEIKDTVSYPIYPVYGIHWSEYGMALSADTLVKFIEKNSGYDLLDLAWEIDKVTTKPEKTDYDVGDALNLLWNHNSEELAYPIALIERNKAKVRPNLLAIADSYYWNIYNSKIFSIIFNNESFWYFGAKVYPESWSKETNVKDLNVKKTVLEKNVILLMVTGRFMHRAWWRKADLLYSIFKPDYVADPVYDQIWEITGYDKWFNTIYKQSKKENKSFAQLIKDHAVFTVNSKNGPVTDPAKIQTKTKAEWINIYISKIKSTPKWLKKVAEKAKNENIPVEEMVKKDAEWCVNEDLKAGKIKIILAVDEKEAGILKIIDEIKNNPKWLKYIEDKAKSNNVPLDEMIRTDAEWEFNKRNNIKE